MKRILIVLAMLWLSQLTVIAAPYPVDDRLPAETRQVALTFTDIDNLQVLADLLKICEEHCVRGTMFFSGKFVRENPEAVKGVAAAGHELGNYGFEHVYWDEATVDSISDELMVAEQEIKAVTGIKPQFIRPPYGYYGDNFLAAVKKSQDGKTVVRGIETGDWILMNAQAILAKVNTEAAPGAIININMKVKYMVEILPQLFGDLRRQGYDFATLSALRGKSSTAGRILPTAREFPFSVVRSFKFDKPVVALTFDDGGDAENTGKILRVLRKYQVPATFFLLGSWMAAYPEITRTIIEHGHEVANHSYNHPRLSNLDEETIESEILATQNVGADVIGSQISKLFRPPYGDYNRQVTDKLQALGYKALVLWNVDSRDWTGIAAADIAREVMQAVSAGSIILFHLHAPHTAEALQLIIPELINKGYDFVRVSTMFQGD